MMNTPTMMILTALLAASTSFAVAAAEPKAKERDASTEKAKQDPYAVQGSGAPTFTMLKGHEKGHVTLDDAEPNSWLAGNFAKCDADKDAKVTEKEFDACTAVK